MTLMDRGLDLSRPTVTTDEEIEAFRAAYRESKGYSLPAFEFWLPVRPDIVKRHRLQVRQTPGPASLEVPAANVLVFLHYYAVIGYEDGILYEARLAQHSGASREEVLDTLAVAFIHAGPMGMRYVASALADYDYEPPPSAPHRPRAYPDGWENDPTAFSSGLDFDVPELLPGEADLVRDWYVANLGEVPAYVEFLARHRPNLLKAYRSRFETAIGTGLPKQMMPYFMLHLNVVRGWPEGIREAALLARGFGMTREQVVDAVAWAMFYGGPDSITIAERAVGGLLEQW